MVAQSNNLRKLALLKPKVFYNQGMNQKIEFTQSTKPFLIQSIVIGVGGLILLIFSTSLFRAFDDFASFDASGLTRLARWIVILLIILALLVAYTNSKKVRYYATKDSIIIERGAFGAKQKKIYDMAHVTGMRMDQTFMGAKLGYGNITLDLSMMTNAETIRLIGLDNPEAALAELRGLTKID